MKLSENQLRDFEHAGFLVLPHLFSQREIAALTAELPGLLAEECDENIREKESGEVRTAMGLHLRNPVFAKLVRHPRLVEPALQIAGVELYVQQVKVNAKVAFSGEVWQWHQDFSTHHNEDGVAAPLALNLHIFLDEVTHYNGPLVFVYGSHRRGPAETALDTATTSYPLWTLGPDAVAERVGSRGLVAATGPAGTALIFGDCMVHSSPPNMSPWDRRIFSLILNPVANAQTTFARPEYKHHRNFTPVAPLADGCLLEGGDAV
jgi:ectoine hydroxylase